MEASGSASGWYLWLDNLDSGLPGAIYSTAVLLTRDGDGAVFSCGEIVDKSPAIAMERRDAIALEHSRGYADIEPELAWEQWQIVRTTM